MSFSLVDEMRGADFGDKRLDDRLGKVVQELGAKPNLSIPAATHDGAEMKGVYRFFDNDKVLPEKLLEPHIRGTYERISQSDVVVLVQDTTELDLTRPKQQVRGAGPMDCTTRRGAFFHPLMAFDSGGLPLGTVWQKSWARETIETSLTASEKAKNRQKRPIEEKESIRWLEGIREARKVAEACPQTKCVCVCDSEADIYEMFSEPRGKVQLLIRAGQNRNTTDRVDWLDTVRATPCLSEYAVNVSARTAKLAVTKSKRHKSRDARIAKVEVRATSVTLRPPHRPDRELPEVTINLILVEEPNPPKGCQAIQWLLVTTLPIDTLEQIETIIHLYCLRWPIEIYFRTLKTGCRVEERQFKTLTRQVNCLAVYSVIAWKIMYLTYLGRECPDLNCDVVFEPSEWKSVYTMVTRETPPEKPPRLNKIIRMIASLGGYVDRKSTQPGPQTLWVGLQRVHDLSTAWDVFGPEKPFFSDKTCVLR